MRSRTTRRAIPHRAVRPDARVTLMMTMKFAAALALAAAVSSPALAQASPKDFAKLLDHGSIYTTVGLDGVGLGAGIQPYKNVGLRAEYSRFESNSYDVDADNISYVGKMTLGGARILADYFPFDGDFRLTAGVAVSNDTEFDATARPSAEGLLNVNGKDYAIPSGSPVNANVSFSGVAPYVGIGWGHNARSGKGLGFVADVGVMFQDPTVSLSMNPEVAALVGADNIEAERRALEKELDMLKAMPVAKVGLSYRW